MTYSHPQRRPTLIGFVSPTTANEARQADAQFLAELTTFAPFQPPSRPIAPSLRRHGPAAQFRAIRARLTARTPAQTAQTAEDALTKASAVFTWNGTDFVNRITGTRRTVTEVATIYGCDSAELLVLLQRGG